VNGRTAEWTVLMTERLQLGIVTCAVMFCFLSPSADDFTAVTALFFVSSPRYAVRERSEVILPNAETGPAGGWHVQDISSPP